MAELRFARLPVDGPMTGGFGAPYGGYLHRGVDYGVPEGTPVYAPADGIVVSYFNPSGSFGTAVCLNHVGTPWYSLYAHLSSKVVNVGQMVKAGDLLGYSGNTGVSSGPHLHWQVCLSSNFPTDISQSADPLSFYHPEDDLPMRPEERAEIDAMKAELVYAKSGADQAFALNQAAMSTLGSFADFQVRMLGVEAKIDALVAQLQQHMTMPHGYTGGGL